MAYKKITIEFEDGRVYEIENPIAYKVWQWEDVEVALRDDVLDYDTPEEEAKRLFGIAKTRLDERRLRAFLEECHDYEWNAIAELTAEAIEEEKGE